MVSISLPGEKKNRILPSYKTRHLHTPAAVSPSSADCKPTSLVSLSVSPFKKTKRRVCRCYLDGSTAVQLHPLDRDTLCRIGHQSTWQSVVNRDLRELVHGPSPGSEQKPHLTDRFSLFVFPDTRVRVLCIYLSLSVNWHT